MTDTIIVSDASGSGAPPLMRDATPEEQAALDAIRAEEAARVTYVETRRVEATVRTTGAAPLEVFRFPCDQLRLYRANLIVSGVDAGNFVSRILEGRFTWKRVTGNAVMVGVTVVSNIGDAASASWAPNAAPSGTEIVFTVAGAADRTIDWHLAGTIGVYAPGGLEA